jgi:hypothetical protein
MQVCAFVRPIASEIRTSTVVSRGEEFAITSRLTEPAVSDGTSAKTAAPSRANKKSLLCFFNSQSNLVAIGATHQFGDRVRDRRFDLLFVVYSRTPGI